MASTTYTATDDWSATARYTADDETAVLISNLGLVGRPLMWVTTLDDEPPAIPPTDANPVVFGHPQTLTLAEGERLWLAQPFRGAQVRARVQE